MCLHTQDVAHPGLVLFSGLYAGALLLAPALSKQLTAQGQTHLASGAFACILNPLSSLLLHISGLQVKADAVSQYTHALPFTLFSHVCFTFASALHLRNMQLCLLSKVHWHSVQGCCLAFGHAWHQMWDSRWRCVFCLFACVCVCVVCFPLAIRGHYKITQMLNAFTRLHANA